MASSIQWIIEGPNFQCLKIWDNAEIEIIKVCKSDNSLTILLQYGSKSNSLSPKPSHMQAESWLNSHSSINSNTVTATLPIKNSRVGKKPLPYSSEKLKNFRKRFKEIFFLSWFLLLSFTNSQWRKLNIVKPRSWIYNK